ncbi:MAG: pitrilysin family protein [Solirubrobacterales bacterium]
MAQEHQLTQLDSGIRVVTEKITSVRSVALGFWVRVGSRDESPAQAGISHFLEHMLFKGTPELSAAQIAETFDGFGAELNAATSKETTVVYAHFLDEHLERAFEVMSDMLLRCTYADLESEREVVLEEIAMYEDEPQDKVHDVLSTAVFGDHPLGRPVIGRGEVVGALTVDDVSSYHHTRYVPGSVVVAAAGNLEHDRIVELAQRCLAIDGGDAAGSLNGGVPGVSARRSFYAKDTEQYHICLGGMGIKRDDDRRYALALLDAILGGSSSSRLFQEVREKRGLAYSVYSWASQYLDSGQIGIYVGTREDTVAEAVATIATELERIREPVPAQELDRAREQVKGRMALSMESTRARMTRLGSNVLLGLPLLSLDETFERVDAVTVDDVVALATVFYDSTKMSAAAVGRDEDRFRSALEPISASLAAV